MIRITRRLLAPLVVATMLPLHAVQAQGSSAPAPAPAVAKRSHYLYVLRLAPRAAATWWRRRAGQAGGG